MATATKKKATKRSTNGAQQPTTIELPPLDIRTVQLTVVGDSPLIMNKWSEKAKQAMRDAQTKQARAQREAKDPHQCYLDSIHRCADGRPGMPGVCFKAAAVRSAKGMPGMSMTDARQWFHVVEDMVPVEGDHQMREDMVRNANGVADIRYRAEFPAWRATFTVRYNASMVSAAQVVQLFNIAGFGNGIGEWRPQKHPTGSYGLFHVATSGELEGGGADG